MIITAMSPMQIGVLIIIAIIFCIILGVMLYKKFHPKKNQEQQEEQIIIGHGEKDNAEIRRNRHKNS